MKNMHSFEIFKISFCFQSQISRNSQIADHCIQYGLSDPKSPDLQSQCEHSHDSVCHGCAQLSSTLKKIEECIHSVNDDAQEDRLYVMQQATSAIYAMKCHFLRAVAQDECRKEMLSNLEAGTGLVVMDWAMKYLPRMYRETQSDWYGRRGLSWHISVLYTKVEEEVHTETFIHVFQNCGQDGPAVAAIIKHLKEELDKRGTLHSLSLRSDNAGCYHNSSVPLVVQQLSKVGMKISSVHFSEAQDGKGPCDRKAGSVKAHVLRYINEGHNVSDAAELKVAIESNGGVRDCLVYLCEAPVDAKLEKAKLANISAFTDFEFTNAGLTVWKAFGVGQGKSMSWKDITRSKVPTRWQPPALTVVEEPGVIRMSEPASSVREPAATAQGPQDPPPEVPTKDGQGILFMCPEDLCMASFQRYSNLQRHLERGLHTEREPTLLADVAKTTFSKVMVSTLATQQPCASTSAEQNMPSVLPTGWALKIRAGGGRFSDKQRDYLIAKFEEGERTGRKHTPEGVAKSMKTAKDKHGAHLFTHEEFLNPTQIAGFWKRHASKSHGQLRDLRDIAAAEMASVASSIASSIESEV